MSEEKQLYEAEIDELAEAEYIKEAIELLGTGYDKRQPAAIIEPSRMVTSVDENGLTQYRAWGWVKMSARFISHLKKLKGAKLAIWQCIALSIDESGKCKMPIKTICGLTGYSHTEVIDSVKELEAGGYLAVNKDGKSNIYQPIFVARGEGKNPQETLVKKLDSTPVYKNESSPAIENSAPSLRVKEFNDINERFMLLKKLYQENIGAIVPLMLDILRNTAITYPDATWYAPAFEIAITNNARNWNYVEKVLRNWKEYGRGWSPVVDTTKTQKPNRRQRPKSDDDQHDYDALRKIAAEAIAKQQAGAQ